jgi:hypothetical protein
MNYPPEFAVETAIHPGCLNASHQKPAFHAVLSDVTTPAAGLRGHDPGFFRLAVGRHPEKSRPSPAAIGKSRLDTRIPALHRFAVEEILRAETLPVSSNSAIVSQVSQIDIAGCHIRLVTDIRTLVRGTPVISVTGGINTRIRGTATATLVVDLVIRTGNALRISGADIQRRTENILRRA